MEFRGNNNNTEKKEVIKENTKSVRFADEACDGYLSSKALREMDEQ